MASKVILRLLFFPGGLSGNGSGISSASSAFSCWGAISPYRHSEQTASTFQSEEGRVDGIASVKDEFSIIGLAVEALHKLNSERYVPFLFMHELTHLNHLKHGPEFNDALDQMIDRFNSETGLAVKNYDNFA